MRPCEQSSSLRRLARVSVLALLLCACGPELEVGSDVIWATDHETGDLTDWYAPPAGGLLPDMDMSVTIADTLAHSGRYSLEFTDTAESDTVGPGVYRELVAPHDLYYSAWYYIPRLYQTNSQWTIMKFRSRLDSDPTMISHGHDLNLRTLPGGQVILYVYSHDPTYLQAPLADPPAIVPVETWFQLETFYRPRTDETGILKVWLNDRLVYDLENRRTAGSDDVLWTPCNIGEDVQPLGSPPDDPGAGEGGAGGAGGASSASISASGTGAASSMRIPTELYIDDAAISLRRVTRSGKIVARK